jgi:hypothetical protein
MWFFLLLALTPREHTVIAREGGIAGWAIRLSLYLYVLKKKKETG